MERTLGDQIAIETELADNLDPTVADPGQIESALLNLAINARDAMLDGGTLSSATHNTVLDDDYVDTLIDVAPGKYVALSVTDTGTGVAPEVLDRVFEPFYTTKGVGASSGLGLSMIYGFAKQSGGHVSIYSEIDQGTTITLFLPSTDDPQDASAPEPNTEIPASAHETILVVEDAPLVRRLTVKRLEKLGYHVVATSNGPEAITMLEANPSIDLVLSDMMMPGGMDGYDVADKALTINPALKILLATGFAKGAETERARAGQQAFTLLRKPYSLAELANALRALLD